MVRRASRVLKDNKVTKGQPETRALKEVQVIRVHRAEALKGTRENKEAQVRQVLTQKEKPVTEVPRALKEQLEIKVRKATRVRKVQGVLKDLLLLGYKGQEVTKVYKEQTGKDLGDLRVQEVPLGLQDQRGLKDSKALKVIKVRTVFKARKVTKVHKVYKDLKATSEILGLKVAQAQPVQKAQQVMRWPAHKEAKAH